MKATHRVEIGCECIGVSGLKLRDEAQDVFSDELLRGLRLPFFTGGSRVAGVAAGVGVVAAVCVRHDVRSPLVPAWGKILKEGVCLKPNFFV